MGGSGMAQTMYFKQFTIVDEVYDLDLFSRFLIGGIRLSGDFKDYIANEYGNYFKNQING